MFLTDLLAFWKKSSLVDRAHAQCVEMLRTGQKMFEYSLGVLMDNEREVDDIYEMDKLLNHGEVRVRRMVAEHLTVNRQDDVIPALFIAAVVGDIERIGDYCKNLIELARHYPEKLEGPYIDRVREIKAEVSKMYEDTIKALIEGDEKLAASVMERHADLARACDGLTERLLSEEGMPGRKAIIRALLIRFLKRVSAHLKNVASSLVNPYPKLGYKPDGTPDDPDE